MRGPSGRAPGTLENMQQYKEILEAALRLAQVERAELAHELLATLGTAEVAPEFALELTRRIREVETGTVKPIPWSEVRAEARLELREAVRWYR